jgi:hypothetical protein
MRILNQVINTMQEVKSFDDFALEYLTYHPSGWADYFMETEEKLQEMLVSDLTLTAHQINLVNEILDDFEYIITASATKIPGIIAKLSVGPYGSLLFNAVTDRQTDFGKKVEACYQYASFRTSSKASWLSDRLQIRACLYCNSQYALSTGKEGLKKRLLFQFDHFYNKSRYPYLSLTLGNLVPSCSTCNIAKSKTAFNSLTHIHPFQEDMNTAFKFRVKEENVLKYILEKRDLALLKPETIFTDVRFSAHQNAFHLNDIYEKHVDVVEELILKALYYNDARRDELKKEYAELFPEHTINRLITGNYVLDSELNQRPLSKLTKDIAQQLHLI